MTARAGFFSSRGLIVASAVILVGALGWFIIEHQPQVPDRCASGLLPLGPRCCALGQHEEQGRCLGNAVNCPTNMQMTSSAGSSQCVAAGQRIQIAGGTVPLAPADWEVEGLTAPRKITVHSFSIDNIEYTWGRHAACVTAGRCDRAQLKIPEPAPEPGLPITQIDPEHAAALCRSDNGRLPSGDEWIVAAAGLAGRRFPWGSTGLVCRRAAFGLQTGPCAHGAAGPDLVASRPDGATPEGVQDLAGNVAEWTIEPQGIVARGGSYRSTVAGQLKIWASEAAVGPQPHIGFRCVYDRN